MAWSHIKGKEGRIVIDNNQVIPIRDWSLSIEHATEDITVKGDDWNAVVKLQKSWNGSFSGFFDPSDPGIQNILSYIFEGTNDYVTIYLYLNDDVYFYGDAILNLSIDNPVDSVVGLSVDFTGSGPLTYVSG